MPARMLQHSKILLIDVIAKKTYQESCLKKYQLAQIQEIFTWMMSKDLIGFD